MSGDDMVLVGRYIRLYEAEIAHGVLEDAGIFSHIPDRSVGGVAPHYSYGTGGVRLLVRQTTWKRPVQRWRPWPTTLSMSRPRTCCRVPNRLPGRERSASRLRPAGNWPLYPCWAGWSL